MPQDGVGIRKPIGFNQFVIGGFKQLGQVFEGAKAREEMFEKIERDAK